MKELTIEQKAQRYDEASKWVEGIYPTLTHEQQGEAEAFFPELKENRDEKVKQRIIKLIKMSSDVGGFALHKWEADEMLAWLEKQGELVEINPAEFDICLNRLLKQFETLPKEELTSSLGFYLNAVQNDGTYKPDAKQAEQKPQGKSALEAAKEEKVDNANRVEPKFKFGDCVVYDGKVRQIKRVDNEGFATDCSWVGINTNVYKEARLWNISKDAKDGDVLTNWNNTTFIFKAIEDETVKFHMAYNEKWDAVKTPSTKLSHLGLLEPQFEFRPASKEQRDTLMKAMVNAGYTFDFEKKELKKIEHSHAWSEEDERNLQGIIDEIEANKNHAPDYDVATYDRFLSWLKSLKDRITWKPSEEQIQTLRYIIDTVYVGSCTDREVLIKLCKDLKKLKG